MIIQALCELYDRLERGGAGDGPTRLAPFGYTVQRVSFILVLDRDGTLLTIEDARSSDGGADGASKRRSRSLIVPAVPGRTVAIDPGFLCDTTVYMLGVAGEAKPGGKDPDPVRVRRCFEAFRDRHLAAEPIINDPGFKAVCLFLRSWRLTDAGKYPLLKDVAGSFGVFQLRNRSEFVHEAETVRSYWAAHGPGRVGQAGDDVNADSELEGSFRAPSLVSGRTEPLARLHEPAIKGVVGAQSSGAKLASFNCTAFESYGKTQTYNAPVGVQDAFRYCTALNYLLASDRHRIRVGDTTVVYWTESPRAVELFGQVVGGTGGQDEAGLNELQRWADAARQGLRTHLGDPATPFYILGLAPNASRLSIRFWIPGSVGSVMANLASHAAALMLDNPPDGHRAPTLVQIARETAPCKSGWPDDERIAPRLVGETGRAVLTGQPYPASLLGAIIARARTDGWVNQASRAESTLKVGHRRACIIAACLRRRAKEVPMSLNENGPAPYQLGRLFALLDTIAEDASQRSVNRRDKYFAAASANPVTVFPRLLRLSTFDLKKVGAENPAFRISRERQIQAVCDRIATFPSVLSLEDQGLFCLGYYQQRQRIFNPEGQPATT